MTSVNSYVKESILSFPLIFRNRLDVLHHTLAVIGNGARWDEKTGEIYYAYPEDLKHYIPKTREQITERLLGDIPMGDESVSFFTGIIEKLVADEAHLVTIMNDVESRKDDMSIKDGFTVYPQSDYALIMNIPENVSDEWRAACDEIRPILIAHGWKF